MKVYNYILLIAGIILLFNYFGFQTPAAEVLNIFDIDNPSATPLSGWFSSSLALIVGLTFAGIAIGLYFRSSPESFLLLGYTSTLFVLGLDMVAILAHLKSTEATWVFTIVSLVFAPLIIGYVHAVISWWGGKQ